jgi:hypothetical protein
MTEESTQNDRPEEAANGGADHGGTDRGGGYDEAAAAPATAAGAEEALKREGDEYRDNSRRIAAEDVNNPKRTAGELEKAR